MKSSLPLRLTLVAHARTHAQKRGIFPSDEPIELERPDGCLNYCLSENTRLWQAPEIRARQTAALFGGGAETIHALRDCDLGRWAGQTLAEVQAREPDALAQWLQDPQAAPHGGESQAELVLRVGNWLDSLAQGGHCLAVTHPLVIRAAILHVLQCPPGAWYHIDIEPLSVTDLRRNERWRLRTLALEVPD